MELVIMTENSIMEVRFSIDLDFEELGDEGYFYNSKLDKVVIMNHTSLFIWKYLRDSIDINKKVEIDILTIAELISSSFIITDDEKKDLKNDISDSITHFISQGFLELV